MNDPIATKENIRRAEYILNHYSKSKSDTIALARDLTRYDNSCSSMMNKLKQAFLSWWHRWVISEKIYDTPEEIERRVKERK